MEYQGSIVAIAAYIPCSRKYGYMLVGMLERSWALFMIWENVAYLVTMTQANARYAYL